MWGDGAKAFGGRSIYILLLITSDDFYIQIHFTHEYVNSGLQPARNGVLYTSVSF